MPSDTDLIRLDGVSMKYRLARQRQPSFKEYALHWVRGALVYEVNVGGHDVRPATSVRGA